MDCSTIIVSYNTYALTHEAVRTALRSSSTISHEVIVVDNESPDESEQKLRNAFAADARVRIVGSGGNVGFSAANNIGARLATGRVLFFLNPDTVVLDDAVPVLVAFANATPSAGAVGPRVLNPDRSVQRSTMRLPSVRALLHHRFPVLPPPRLPLDAPSRVEVIVGCALAIRRDVFDEVGGWDERYFMYSEEKELCRGAAELGRHSYFVPRAQIIHYGGQASLDRYAEQQLLVAQSESAYLERHAGPGLRALARVSGAVGFGGRAALFRLLAWLSPRKRADYSRRASAADKLWRYYAGAETA